MLGKSLSSLLLIILASANAVGATYYLDSVRGDDANKGTSRSAPWKSLAKVNALTLGPGDRVLFRRNRQFRGTLALHGSGSSTNPITVDAYGKGCKPVLIGDVIGEGGPNGVITLQDLSYYLIQNLEIQAPCMSGVIIRGCSHVTVRDCDFTNIMYLPPGMPEGGDIWSVTITAGKTDGSNNLITHCTFKKCSKGVIILSGDSNILSDSYFFDINDIAALFAGHCVGKTVTNSRIARCIFDYTNNTNRGWNPVMFGGAENCYQEYCETKNTPAGQWDHQVYDFDTNCKNCYIQYCYSHDNLGDLMHSYWVGDANGPCYFRYNISVNDKTLYNSVKTTYGLQMYNNTFYNFRGNFGRNIFASDLSDTVVKNNIFHMRLGAGVDAFPAGSDYNCYYHCSKPSGEAHSMRANPAFMNASRPPCGLQLSPNSPCKNAGESGVDIGAPIPAFTGSLALNCPVTAGSSMEKDSWRRSKVVDGTINTEPNTCGWLSSGNEAVDHEEWITLDLEKDYKINRVVLYPRNDTGYIGAGFPRTFRIRTSRDNINWTVVSAKKDYPQPGVTAWYDGRGEIISDFGDIAYALRKGPITEVWAMKADGTGRHRVKTYLSEWADLGPWMAGSQWILMKTHSRKFTLPNYVDRSADYDQADADPIIMESPVTGRMLMLNIATGRRCKPTCPTSSERT